MITIDEVRAVVAEEIDEALAPIRAALARLGDVHGKGEHEAAAHAGGAAASRRALLRRQAQIRADCGGDEPVEDDVPDPPKEPEAPPAPRRAPTRRVKAPECAQCEGALISDDDGLRCPRCDT